MPAPVCPSGSTPKMGVPALIHVDSVYLQNALAVNVPWLTPFLPFIPPLDIDVAAFCAIDPPELPTLDAADLFALVTGGRVGVLATAIVKVTQLVRAFVWYQLCQCAAGPTPAPPPGPPLPPGSPVINPGTYFPPPLNSPCETFSADTYQPPVEGTHHYFDDRPLKAGASVLRLTYTNVEQPTNHGAFLFEFFTSATAGTGYVLKDSAIVPSGQSVVHDLNVTSADAFLLARVGYSPYANYTDNIARFKMDSFCGGLYPTPCPTTDPYLLGYIQQILSLVTLIQRQAAPFGYVPGAVHAGLSGSGQLAIADLVGVAIDLTTTPAYLGVRGGDPPTIFDVGWVRFGTADGWTSRQRVDSDPWLWLPGDGGAYTLLGYTFDPGIVATIHELVREP